jgi:hypothetical protein
MIDEHPMVRRAYHVDNNDFIAVIRAEDEKSVRDVFDQAVSLKLPEGFSYRSPADIVSLAYCLLGELAAVRDGTGEYVFLQFSI